MAGVVHEDVGLVGRQYDDKTRIVATTYSFEVPMNYVASMKVAEALGDIGYLLTGMRVESIQRDKHLRDKTGLH